MTANSTSSDPFPTISTNDPQIPDLDLSSNQHHHLQSQLSQLHPIHTAPTSHPKHSNRVSTSIVNVNDHTGYGLQSPDTAGTQMTKGSLSGWPLLNSSKDKIDVLSQYGTLPATTIQFEDSKAEEDSIQHRHPSKVRGSIYTRLFRLDSPQTQSKVIVQSSWLPTGALFSVRFLMFLYASIVLIADMFLTERIKFEFCYLTQLSYLGLIAYLGTTSWHTFSEWRRQRALQASSTSTTDAISQAEAAGNSITETRTSIEKQHWLLTDMIFFLYHTVCTFHVIVPLLYWGYLAYAGDARGMALGIPRNALWRNYSFHGGDLILVLIEFIINTMPFISSHILIVYVVCLLYMGEAFVVYRVNGFWMYPFLDTTVGPIWVAYYIGVGFVIMCAFFLMYFLHRLRDRSPKQKKQQNQDHSSDLQQSQHQGEDSQNHSAYDIGEPSIDGYKDQEEINGDLDSKNANKNRSRSDSSVSTTSTLVGNDEVGPKDQERERPLSRKASRRMSFLGDLPSIILGTEHPNHLDHAEESSTPTERLEIVEEGNETETEDSEENHL